MVHVRISVAIVMPEIGFDELPMSPVMRDDTLTKKKPKRIVRTAASGLPNVGRRGTATRKMASASEPPRTTVSGRSRSVRDAGRAAAGAQPLHALAERRHDRRNRAAQRDEARGQHRAGADVPDVGAPDLPGRICESIRPLAGTGGNGHRHVVAEDRQQRHQHHPREHASGEHDARDARPDDVADAHVLGRDVDVHCRVRKKLSAGIE